MSTVKEQKNVLPIHFTAKLNKIGSWIVIKLPKSASVMLPSRGMAMVDGIINDFSFQVALEPDGKGSHWFRVTENIKKGAGIDVDETVTIAIKISKDWPEPKIPADLKHALETDSKIHTLWMDITSSARWDWIRWISATKQEGTRKRRIEVALSKLKKGSRRPCCFNRTICTVPEVSHNGMLVESI